MHPKRIENPQAKRPNVQDKTLDGFIKKAWAAGWWARKCGGSGHVMCYHPTDLGEKVLVNNSAGDPRVIPMVRRDFAQAGLKV